MKIVVTGGIGSGKSTVAKMLAEKLNFALISIDQIVCDLYANNQKLHSNLLSTFGTVSREKLSNIVFDNPESLETLETIFKPFITESLHKLIASYSNVIVEFPLYFEKGSDIKFDMVVSVNSYMKIRAARVINRDGDSPDKVNRLMKIIDLQVSDEYREANSDYVIYNNYTMRELEIYVDELSAHVGRKQMSDSLKIQPKSHKKIGLVSGSFDPITLGHTWVIQKALDVVDEVVIAVAINPNKKQLFTPDEREQLITETMKETLTPEQFTRISVSYIKSDEMTVSYATSVNAKFIFRGLRNQTDFEYENQLNLIQKKIAPEIETIFLMTPRELIEISSSLIKGLLSLREWERVAEPYVSKAVFKKLKQITQK